MMEIEMVVGGSTHAEIRSRTVDASRIYSLPDTGHDERIAVLEARVASLEDAICQISVDLQAVGQISK